MPSSVTIWTKYRFQKKKRRSRKYFLRINSLKIPNAIKTLICTFKKVKKLQV